MATSSNLASLPVAIHGGQAVSRLSAAQLCSFEDMLGTADATIEAAMQARAAPPSVTSEEGAAAVLQAVVDTVTALSDAPPPTSLTSKAAAVAWVSQALLDMRRRAVDGARGRLAPGMDPTTIGAVMELISKLNTAIGGTPQ